MLIIEGPDKVGKTTLAKRIAQDLGMQFSSLGLLPDTWDYYKDYESRIGPMVWDRFHLSEVVYGHKLRGTHNIPWDTLRRINSRLIDAGCVILVITNRPHNYKKRLLREPDKKFNIEQLLSVNAGFHELVRTGVSKYLIDFHCDLEHDEYLNFDTPQVRAILRKLKERRI